ncbi:pyridoxal-dependent aspartate 1-decarboxylase PanP [uncultured Pseudoteredinibacter sp.]|uniref:pyridoxal-dependent aspartate 1-decarboxylase PanP n=1 Tax=uncultured Pseudoteredinibacter sp. TaxID=1641701 RepID=UPI002607AE21|nr:putative pyridoxal-dependent aspartate 1-decarboxylase [uncultured Pseudoteredinibacter sp.]
MKDDLSLSQAWFGALKTFEFDAAELAEFERQLSFQVEQHLQANERPGLSNNSKIEQCFYSSELPEQAQSYADYSRLLNQAVRGTVNTTRPDFIGHMTSALPAFMPVVQKLMAALNQNNVKLETSGYFTDLERQVLAMLHRCFFSADRSSEQLDHFYQANMHQPKQAFGVFCSGGTLANIMALWVARNRLLSKYQLAEKGLLGAMSAMAADGYQGLAVLVSERGHYSLSKAADVLGLGRENLVAVAVDDKHRMDMPALREQVVELQNRRIKILALVAVAGATETGSIDPLNDMADLAEDLGCHLHVDGAWGGAAIFSAQHRDKLAGIERADSITLDAHKQLYVPMGAGMVLFKDPEHVNAIKQHASYIIRSDSKDLGAYTLEGSRPAVSLLLHAGLHLIGSAGYGALVDHSVAMAKAFAELIEASEDFELILQPELNILAYRYCPPADKAVLDAALADADVLRLEALNKRLSDQTVAIQIAQAAANQGFVSRTQLHLPHYGRDPIHVFRVVLANPYTQLEHLQQILAEQRAIASDLF